MTSKLLSGAALLVVILPVTALANDGIGAVGAGGIVVGKTDAVAMKKEVLNVSYDKISVDYVFLNESDKDVDEAIFFPLPEYGPASESAESYYGQPAGFSVTVDGAPVVYKTVVLALAGGANVGAALKEIGLDDAQIAHYPLSSPFEGRVKPISAKQEKLLAERNLLVRSMSGGHWVPNWTVQINYVWRQKFPAHKEVRVHHQYRPFASAGPGYAYVGDVPEKNYCADKNFNAASAGRERPDGAAARASFISYILKTGNTWKNGIEDFTLNLVKNDPSELVTLCFPGKFKKINATTLQVQLKNFKPKQDLDVYFGNIREQADHRGVAPKIAR
jgi:hypothetical protein